MASFFKRLLDIGKKLFIAVAVYTLVIAGFIVFSNPNQFKLSTSEFYKESSRPLYEKVNDPKNNDSQEEKISNQLVSFIGCQTIGELCTPNQEPGSKEHFRGSALGTIASTLATPLVYPPASGVYWAQENLQKIGVVPKSYAAEGIGLAGIRPFAGIWTLFRNVTYLLLTLLVVAIGLMIMFRFKVNPQTVVTLENSLPRIVITLLLITFSFPIAGFMIDLMYAFILGSISIFSAVDPEHFNSATLNRLYVTANFTALWGGFFPSTGAGSLNPLGQFVGLADLGSSLIEVLPDVVGDSVRVIGAAAITAGLVRITIGEGGFLAPLKDMIKNLSALGFSAGSLGSSIVYYVILIAIAAITIPFTLTFGGGWILAIIIWLTLVFLFFRIMVMLFAAYLRIILYVIFSPFLILSTALPGRNGFTGWLRSLAGELAIFPTVIILLLVGRLIVMAFTLNPGTVYNPGNWFGPDSEKGIWTPPFLWGINQRSLAIIVGMQIIFLIPSIANTVRQKISGNKGMPFKAGAGIFFGGLAGVTTGALGGVGRFGSLSHGFQGLKAIPGMEKLAGKMGAKMEAHKSNTSRQ